MILAIALTVGFKTLGYSPELQPSVPVQLPFKWTLLPGPTDNGSHTAAPLAYYTHQRCKYFPFLFAAAQGLI